MIFGLNISYPNHSDIFHFQKCVALCIPHNGISINSIYCEILYCLCSTLKYLLVDVYLSSFVVIPFMTKVGEYEQTMPPTAANNSLKFHDFMHFLFHLFDLSI